MRTTKKTKLRDRGQLYIVRSRAGILLERHPPSGCSNDPLLVYLDRTAAAVSKKAWYDLMASGADIVANQSVLSPWTFGTASKTALILAGGADAISFARPASKRALMPALFAGVLTTYLSKTPVPAQSMEGAATGATAFSGLAFTTSARSLKAWKVASAS